MNNIVITMECNDKINKDDECDHYLKGEKNVCQYAEWYDCYYCTNKRAIEEASRQYLERKLQ